MPLQVRMLTSKSLEAERERSASRDAKHVDNPRMQGLLDGTKPGGTRKPRISASASYCVSYKLDENGNKVGAHVFTPGNRKPNRRSVPREVREEINVAIMEKEQHRVRMAAIVGNIGNVE